MPIYHDYTIRFFSLFFLCSHSFADPNGEKILKNYIDKSRVGKKIKRTMEKIKRNERSEKKQRNERREEKKPKPTKFIIHHAEKTIILHAYRIFIHLWNGVLCVYSLTIRSTFVHLQDISRVLCVCVRYRIKEICGVHRNINDDNKDRESKQ